jgi:hypothetical protein
LTSLVDEKYYEVIESSGVAEKALIKARDRIFREFLDRMQPTPASKKLDVGVSDVISDAANVLERSYPFPEKVTACGVGSASSSSVNIRALPIDASNRTRGCP